MPRDRERERENENFCVQLLDRIESIFVITFFSLRKHIVTSLVAWMSMNAFIVLILTNVRGDQGPKQAEWSLMPLAHQSLEKGQREEPEGFIRVRWWYAAYYFRGKNNSLEI